MGRLEDIRELRREHEQQERNRVHATTEYPTLEEFVRRVAFADGSERVPADFKVEGCLGTIQVTFYEHMEGWKAVVHVNAWEDVLGALEAMLNDLDHPRQPYKTYKQLPRWWTDFQKKNGHKA